MTASISPVIVDTDVVSFAFKKDTRAALYQPHLDDRLTYISFQTFAELEHWAIARHWGARQYSELLQFIGDRFAIIHSDDPLCRVWAEVKEQVRQAGYAIQPTDAWIAATALLYGVPLVTHNRADFEHVPGLTVISES